MDRWHIPSVEAAGRREPRVLFSTPECRAVVIDLRAGEGLGEHSVHERAVVEVVTGSVRVTASGTEMTCGGGTLLTFDPQERHAISAVDDTRLLLMLSPIIWTAKVVPAGSPFLVYNPVTYIIDAARTPLLAGGTDYMSVLVSAILAVAGSIAAYLLYRRTEHRIPYWL